MDVSRRSFLKFCGLGVLSVGGSSVLAACAPSEKKEEGAKGAKVEHKDKPVVFFNRQPSNSSTGELDTNTLNFNKDTYYVGFDAVQGAELQGQMVLDYIKAHAAELTFLQLVTLVTTTLSLVLVVSVRHLVLASRRTARLFLIQ